MEIIICVYCLFVILVISRFGFEGGILALFAPVPALLFNLPLCNFRLCVHALYLQWYFSIETKSILDKYLGPVVQS